MTAMDSAEALYSCSGILRPNELANERAASRPDYSAAGSLARVLLCYK